MEACEGSVELGKIVCATSEYALSLIRAFKVYIGARSIASGRRPSMLRIRARVGRVQEVGLGSWAITGVIVWVGGWKGVGVGELTDSGLGGGAGAWVGMQALKTCSDKIRIRIRLREKCIKNDH
jgi:hypothetical protein